MKLNCWTIEATKLNFFNEEKQTTYNIKLHMLVFSLGKPKKKKEN